MKNYDIIFFDLDDTLFDFAKSEQIAFNTVFNKFNLKNNIDLYENRYHQINKKLWRDLEDGKINLDELGSGRFKKLFLEHGLEIEAGVFNQDYLTILGEQAHLIPGAEEVIRLLSHKRLAVITNGQTVVQRSRINRSPLKDAFEHIIISESTGYQKPQTGIFDYAFDKMKITNKSNVLMVGDSLTADIQGGINYGIDTCWFNPRKMHNNTSLKATYEINKLETLLEEIIK